MTPWSSNGMQRRGTPLVSNVGNALLSSLLLFSALSSGGGLVEGENIAFFHPTGSYSHRVSIWPLVERLVGKGHHITFISSYPPKNPLPNVTEIIPTQMAKYINDYMQGGDLDITRRISGDLEACYDHGPRMGYLSCEKFLEDPVVVEWLRSQPKIDLFIVDWFGAECILGLAYKLKAPVIWYASTVMTGIYYETFGILPDTAGIPDFEHHFTPPMNFRERLDNTLQPLIWQYKMSKYFDELGVLLREKFEIPDMPPLEDLVRNASLMLWSESFIEGYPHQLPPNWVTVAGMHCKEKTDPLPKDIEKIVQNGKDGFIYISFGSAVVPGNLPKGHRDAFFNAIGAFPNIQFLWKWTGEMPKEKLPDNLYIGTWFPQQDILAHKRLLGFVSQAGRPSTQEAIFHGAPMIVIPVYEDQDYTAERIRDMGGAIKLEIATITQQEIEDAFRNISTDPKYRQRMQHLSKLFKDRPMNPTETALYWTEYVLRHKNLDHLRTPSYHLTWYERRALDVWALLFTAALLIIAASLTLAILCVKLLLRKIIPSSSGNVTVSTKRKAEKKKTR